MSRYIFIDTETGGIDPKTSSLLSIGIVIWEDRKILLEDEFYIKDKSYMVSKVAIDINKINLDDVNNQGISKQDAVNRIKEIIKEYFSNGRAIIAGHNVQFDIRFLRRLFLDVGEEYNNYFSHRIVETSSIIRFLGDAELIPQNLEASDEAFKYFDIVIEKRHSALGDAKGTAKLYEILLEKV